MGQLTCTDLCKNIRHVVSTSQKHTGSVLCASALLCTHTDRFGAKQTPQVSFAQCSNLQSTKLNAIKHSNYN